MTKKRKPEPIKTPTVPDDEWRRHQANANQREDEEMRSMRNASSDRAQTLVGTRRA